MSKIFSIKNYRAKVVSSNDITNITSICIPGGPGLGFEYLDPFVTQLNLPGQAVLVDFPGKDPDNILQRSADRWKTQLLSIVRYFSPCILITHSFSGMMALEIPELEAELSGLILMNTSPVRDYSLNTELYSPEVIDAKTIYFDNPNDLTLKKLFLAYKYYFFLPEEMKKGEELLAKCSVSYQSFNWGWQHFIPSYRAKWLPTKIPGLIVSGEGDLLCPPDLFLDNSDYSSHANITFCVIENAGHFPWLNQFNTVKKAFNIFYKQLITENYKSK